MKTSSTEILQELVSSATHGHIIGIKMKDESRMLITAVEKVFNQTSIKLRPSSVVGNSYQPNAIEVTQIESVIRFNSLFEDALAVQVRAIKKALRI
jgi:hypothetical protein